jgi:hypothetical protein
VPAKAARVSATACRVAVIVDELMTTPARESLVQATSAVSGPKLLGDFDNHVREPVCSDRTAVDLDKARADLNRQRHGIAR